MADFLTTADTIARIEKVRPGGRHDAPVAKTAHRIDQGTIVLMAGEQVSSLKVVAFM